MVYVKGDGKEIRISELFAPGGYLFRGGELLGTGTYSGPIEYEDPETGQGKRTVAFYAHGANAVEVMVNEETGEVKVLRIGACFDMGQPINPKLCEGQMEGGAVMGIGTALYEEMVLENGVVANSNFLDYKIPSSMDVPTCENVKSMIATAPHREGPFGAKGFSEGAMVALSPAIANAISRATGVRIRDLPITKEKVLKQLKRITGQRNK
jgi:CO/xanthine dehydrogenase Mo-binding subunit